MLYEAARHEAVTTQPWDASRVQAGIEAIVRDAEARLDPQTLWPTHPLDVEPDYPCPAFKSLYFGAAGTLWALWHLEQQQAVQLTLNPKALIQQILEAYVHQPDSQAAAPSYFLGEVGILLLHYRLTGSPEVAERLFEQIRINIPNPTHENFWGASGTMLGAWYMLEWTGESRWRELFLQNVEQLWQTWHMDEGLGCYLWTQDLYGQVCCMLGAGHGYAGNVYPLLKGAVLLTEEQRESLYDRCLQTYLATARHEGELVNWLPHTGPFPVDRKPKILIQWCHGAPGIVTALGDLPPGARPALDALLFRAGETIWQAGPVVKGPSICHGTAGNGYAFLKLYRRTGNPLWLTRARTFAMHALEQTGQMRQRHGQGRYSLFTGDPGVALYLWHCLTEGDALPGLDVV